MTVLSGYNSIDLLEIVRRVERLASEQGLDPAEATRLAAISICQVRPQWEMHQALQFVWQHRP